MVNPDILNRKDPLTGFHTKEGLSEYLHSKISSVYEKINRLTVIIIDLDNFKNINDRYGHLVGDDALRHFSMVINKALQGRHFVARYGGDEFVIVMQDTPDGKESMGVANRIKSILNKEKFYTTRSRIFIRSSIGMATFPEDAKTVRGLLEMADNALYYAKKHGRDKVVSCRRIRTHFISDKILLASRWAIMGLLVFLMYLTYQKTDSFKGLVAYYRNNQQYFSYLASRFRHQYNYYTIDLLEGRKIEGWLIRENAHEIVLSIAKPALNLNPLVFNSISFSPTVKIPKGYILSSAKILK